MNGNPIDEREDKPEDISFDDLLDCIGYSSPMPIIKLADKLETMKSGKTLKLLTTDPETKLSVPEWCQRTNNMYRGITKTPLEAEGSFVYNHFVKKI